MNTLEILDRLIAFDTTSRNPNRALIDWVAGLLRGAGAEVSLLPDETGAKANLFATLGPRDRPGVCLSGHTDVVPVDGQAWTRPPFRLTRDAGRLYGRGTADMKGFVACALRAALAAPELSTPLHIALSHDEEIGCVGVRSLVDRLARAPVRPALCIVGEPTSMRVATGHKGKIAARAICHGEAAHSSLAPRPVNAIHLAAELVGAIRAVATRLEREGARDPAYAIPHTTVHVGTIAGGTALNIVPDRAELRFEIRAVAGDDPQQILAEIDAEAHRIALAAGAPARIEIETLPGSYPGLEMPEDAEAVRFVREIAGGDQAPLKVPFGTEAGLFAEVAGIPAVVCGPGSMAQGHRADEFIEESQIAACDAMLDRLLARLARGL